MSSTSLHSNAIRTTLAYVRRLTAVALAGVLAMLCMSGTAYAYHPPIGGSVNATSTASHSASSGLGLTTMVGIAVLVVVVASVGLLAVRMAHRTSVPTTREA